MPILHLIFEKTRNLKYIYAIRLIRELSNQLMIFFLPIFLFGLHLPMAARFGLSNLQEGIFNVALIYLLTYVVVFLSAIPIASLLIKYGMRHGFLMGNLLYAVFVLCLYLAKINIYWIFASALVNGLQINFFWNSYHYVLSQNSAKTKIGSNLGFINVLLNLLAMIAPALGGIIIVALGYETLFLLGLAVVLAGVLFAVSLDNVRVRDVISWREFSLWLREAGFRRLAVSFAGRYFNDASVSLWTLYIFILLGSTDGVGYFYSLALLLALLVNFVAGKWIDRKHSRQGFFLSGGMMSVFWLIRGALVDVWSITILNAVDKINSSFYSLFFDRSWILRGKGREALSYFVYREMIFSLAAIFFWSLVFALFYFLGNAWKDLFAVAAVGVLLSLLIKDHKSTG